MSKSKLAVAWLAACLVLAWMAGSPAGAPEKPPADGGKSDRDIEFVEDDTPEAPSEPPIQRRVEPPPPDAVPGSLTLSNGDRVEGHIHLTRDAALKFHDPDRKKLLHIRLHELTHIEQKPVIERMEKEWRWLENANDQKVYTGREYPMRKLTTVLHLKTGRTLRGPLTALLYVSNENGRRRFVLHKRQKGKVDTKLSDLIYVKLVDFRPPQSKDQKKEEPSANQ